MRLALCLSLATAIPLATSLFAPSTASAQEPPAAGAPEAGPRFRPFSITLNPLGIGILQRFGANFEYMVAKHHGVWLYPFYTSFSTEANVGTFTSKSSISGFGGEIGYHFYTGEKGANGFFVGPTAGVFNLKTKSSCTGCGPLSSSAESSGTSAHVGIDLGGQHVFDNGITLGGGGGLMRFVSSSDTKSDSSFSKFSGTLPRFLFTVGYSFLSSATSPRGFVKVLCSCPRSRLRNALLF